ncbi:unnamed protein product [Ambrosiozyma monospora]|uniref:Unnamed protein product n=1 Tax=Ambrosiozyma monospora TaxID=43982 RepID=A0ACB5TWD3_AMBMO|nr:unnamed protein product [Ambrosiozyma monospora]
MFASSGTVAKGYLFGVPPPQQGPVLPLFHQRHPSYQSFTNYQQPSAAAPPPSSQPQQSYQQQQQQYGAGYSNYYNPIQASSVPRNDYYVAQQQVPPPPAASQQQQVVQLPPLPPPSSSYMQQQPVQPPLQPIHQQPLPQAQSQPQQKQHHQHQEQPQEQATGGVSSVLDYDMDQMVRFVCWLCYGLMKRSDNPPESFHDTVKSVLAATRLPKSSLVLALLYLSDKMAKQVVAVMDDAEVFQNLIISLVLANKFNDDNTFRNKSWSDATGLSVSLINKLEKEWLCSISWRLHYDTGYQCIEECWDTWCKKFNVNKSALSESISPDMYPAASTSPVVGYHSPSTSLFSERSQQYSPVNTPLNSSPWFEDYHVVPVQCGL